MDGQKGKLLWRRNLVLEGAVGRKILVIEDDALARKLLEDYLGVRGYDVVCATNGADGVAMARSTEPDLVVCDVLLPRKSGYEVCFELKRPSAGRSFPVLLMSAILQDAPQQAYAAELKADGMFVKPFRMKAMLERIEQLLPA